MKTIRFYKDSKGWFADIPEWPGDKGELAMVCGADDMLEIYAQGEPEVTLNIDTTFFNGSEVLSLVRPEETLGGGIYKTHKILGIEYDFELWLCEVTIFVFEYLPELIYVQKV